MPESYAQLCTTCGMCCDGTLFHSVELKSGDSARRIASLGIKLRRKKGVEFFLQPCSAHRESQGVCSCKIYDQRPLRCRLFCCRQLLGVESGEISELAAMEKIREARSRIARINELITQVAETNPNRSLAHRVANALTTLHRSSIHDLLASAMQELEEFLLEEFRMD